MRPYTLNPHNSSHKTFKDARIHYATLNTQPHPNPPTATTPTPHHHTHATHTRAAHGNRDALDSPDQERTRDTHPQELPPPQMSSQDPTVCTSLTHNTHPTGQACKPR
jgi:hypothetical protein